MDRSFQEPKEYRMLPNVGREGRTPSLREDWGFWMLPWRCVWRVCSRRISEGLSRDLGACWVTGKGRTSPLMDSWKAHCTDLFALPLLSYPLAVWAWHSATSWSSPLPFRPESSAEIQPTWEHSSVEPWAASEDKEVVFKLSTNPCIHTEDGQLTKCWVDED